jgi:hypothetical protein
VPVLSNQNNKIEMFKLKITRVIWGHLN